MIEQDIHLAAASISHSTRQYIEFVGFVEDLFCDCKNCAQTMYHATFRGDAKLINEALWTTLSSALKSDLEFNGLLEHEHLIKGFYDRCSDDRFSLITPPSLPSQTCPSACHKACDVHIGVKMEGNADRTLAWLDAISIASFKKIRPDGDWRLYTATFDTLAAGERFLDAIRKYVPLGKHAVLKLKLEFIVHVLRHPANAVTLPLTYETQLDSWLHRVENNDTAKAFHRFIKGNDGQRNRANRY